MYEEECNNNSDGSPLQEFYRGAKVLVTGGTGFVGKALVEKLLRACPHLDTIYLLIRPKKGLSPQDRFREYFNCSAFERLRDKEVLKKVRVVSGDVMEEGLGLSPQDTKELCSGVTVVFHSAATVKFNETLHDAVLRNTMGTQNVLLVSKQMVNLQVVIHVSTAYSNANRKDIDEKVYDPPANPQGMIQCVKNLSEDLVEHMATALIKQNHPNTYTITKNMAETIVAQHADQLPVGILRPSIVTAAWKEPFPGWVDNVSGITGIMMEIGRGTIRSIVCNDRYLVDIIPVDIVVDSLIVAAYHTAKFRGKTVQVYNCTSGSINPIYWHQLGDHTLKHSMTTPSKYLQWYPGFSFTTNRVKHFLKDVCLHTFPALILDIVLKIQGSKPIMLKITRRFRAAAKTGEFFALHEWAFRCDNQRALSQHLTKEDGNLFCTDVSKLNWDDYVKSYLLGIRKYVLKDTPETLPAAKRKLRRLFWLKCIGQAFFLYFLFKLIMFR